MTKQEIFDKVATALIRQGHCCVDGDTCSYYTNGSRCAIGWLVDEETAKSFQRDFKSKGIDQLPDNKVDFGVSKEFLAGIQDAHDQCAHKEDFLVEFKLRMLAIARYHGLDPAELCK